MKNDRIKKISAVCLSALMTGLGGLPPRVSAADTGTYTELHAVSQGRNSAHAVLKGSDAVIVSDSSLGSDVLYLKGSSNGGGWLQLPPLFENGCGNGFTLAMKFMLKEEASNYSRLFQFSPVPFASGNSSSYSSPDISIDVKDKTAFRASIFAGSGMDTENDKKHRAIYDLSAKPDTDKWHDLVLVCSPTGADYYIDGQKLSYTADTVSATLNSLFSEKVLSSYVYNSLGRSLYNDDDIAACFDDVAFYTRPLSGSEIGSLPDDAEFLYTFEKNTIEEGEVLPVTETSFSVNGKKVTSVPELQTASPEGDLTVKFWTDGSTYYYSVENSSGVAIIEPSALGIAFSSVSFTGGVTVQPSAAVRKEVDDRYSMPYGKHRQLRDRCTELTFPMKKGSDKLDVIFRIYDDGIGFRYAYGGGATIKEEASQVIFPDNSKFWGNWPNATYEWDMVELPKERPNETASTYSCPYTGVINDKYWVTVTEAGVFNEDEPYCAGALQFVGNYHDLRFKSGVKVESITMKQAFHTPWRAVVIGDSLDRMASSDLILNLNPPSVIEDTSWIKPGKTAWSWWSSGGDSPIEYHTQKDYIDFAAENGWDFVCLDFGWALWDGSEEKVKELCDYGAEKGIGIYLWYGVNNTGHSGYKDSAGHPAYPYYSLLDEETISREFKRVSGLGVKGVKVDYYESDTQQTMKQMNMCAKIAADNHLMVLFHGCTIPRGESRTYPNVISFEAINGSEYYKWFESPSLANRVSYTFTRCVAGSADFTPTGIPIYGIKATAGFALADVVTIESGIQHFAQSVYTYEGSSALPLLNDVPVVWDDMKVLDGYPMQFNVTARRNGSDWYIGASTLAARKVDIHLSDLIDSGTYNAYIFADNADGSDLEVTVLNGLTAEDTISRSLLENGGFVIKLTKGAMKLTTPYSNYRSYEAENAVLSGKASITAGKQGKYCSNDAYVGYVGGDGQSAVTFNDVTVDKAGKYTVRIYYVSGERRSLKVDINGSYVTTLNDLYANKNDWSGIRAVNLEAELKAGKNTIRLYNDRGYGPSIDRIAVAIPESRVIGDVDFNGRLNVADLVLTTRYIQGSITFSTEQHRVADVNEDGTADVFDLIRYRKLLTS
ncbi:glycoside hydrolase family 97 catalytic domain-containing protein [Ruminococcus flavefaciens]|uniref:glycoside hydrolase family 97 catalytic domain-containing protein n=1 Tax=Ruminococcus flavefaciens TaxID=1265 RepID=UPI000490A326|nr:glycoside hydrolase family 97 catalytic domain-containing protein [Ruminococcus flavefaciens]